MRLRHDLLEIINSCLVMPPKIRAADLVEDEGVGGYGSYGPVWSFANVGRRASDMGSKDEEPPEKRIRAAVSERSLDMRDRVTDNTR